MSGTQPVVQFVEKERAELAEVGGPGAPGPGLVVGRTLVSLVSAGTELAVYRGLSGRFPAHPGYAAVCRVTEVGEGVESVAPGERIFCMGGHRLLQEMDQHDLVALPDGLAPESAVFARLMGVSQTTLVTTAARPPARVLVTGLGLVGNLAAQVFAACGYDVIACDPEPARREMASAVGLKRVEASVPVGEGEGTVDLVLECSGHEQAVLDGCRAVRKGGEVVLTGVPWERRSDATAHELLSHVFHRYVVLRSGWEWELPRHRQEFSAGGIWENFAGALRWLSEGRVRTKGLAEVRSPGDAQAVYQDLLHGRCGALSSMFDWREL